MKILILPLLVAVALLGCQRAPEHRDAEAEARREAKLREVDDRIAELKELERRATDQKLSDTERRASESQARAEVAERERRKLEAEREALLQDRKRLADQQAAAETRARQARDEAAEIAQRAERERHQQTVDFFYTALEPHGEWLEVDRYGYVWQPAVSSDPRWRPYTDGRWVFTEYGWFWKSNEPFGWAVYHYGRWAKLRRVGWVWVPGTEWGPAWVSWRRGDRYAGWAPLPPEAWSSSGFTAAVDSYFDIGPSSYTFVPLQDLTQPTYVGRVVELAQNVTIVNQTVNVTNVTYKTVQKNVVAYNDGPGLEALAPRTADEIPRLRVERVAEAGSGREFGRSVQRGETLIVSAPQIRERAIDAKAEAPRSLKARIKETDVERGWEDGDKRELEQARSRVNREANDAELRQREASRSKEQRMAEPPKATPGRVEVPVEGAKDRRPAATEPSATPPASAASDDRRDPSPRRDRKGDDSPATLPRDVSTPAGGTPSASAPSKPEGEPPLRPFKKSSVREPSPAGAIPAATPVPPVAPEPRPETDQLRAAEAVPSPELAGQSIPAAGAAATSAATPDRKLPRAERPRPDRRSPAAAKESDPSTSEKPAIQKTSP
jgi:hypothetical protein